MGGMIVDWNQFHDPVNSISRPVQMGPMWLHARHLSGARLDDRIWLDDPPASSYPACIAFKAAELQSAEAGEMYLLRTRQAVMFQRRNVARREVLLEIAEELREAEPGKFDAQRFAEEMDGPHALNAFRDDLRLTRYWEIGRFPSLILRRQGEQAGILIMGYRPYRVLQAAVEHLLAAAPTSSAAASQTVSL